MTRLADLRPYPGAPRWVKNLAIVTAALTLLAICVVLIDPDSHGPGRHVPDGGGQAPVSGIASGPGPSADGQLGPAPLNGSR